MKLCLGDFGRGSESYYFQMKVAEDNNNLVVILRLLWRSQDKLEKEFK